LSGEAVELKKRSPSGRIYLKYFIVISSILFICVIVAAGLMMMLIRQSARDERLAALQKAAMDISSVIAMQVYDWGMNLEEITNSEELSEAQKEEKAKEITKNAFNVFGQYIKLISNNLNSDFFICNSSGEVWFCKEYSFDEEMSVCEYHKNIVIDSDTRLRVVKGAYIGNLNGLFVENHFIAGTSISFNEEAVITIMGIQPVSAGLQEYTYQMFKYLLISCLLALLLSLISVYFLTYRMTTPIKEISAAAKRYAKGDFSYRVKVKGNDELAEMTLAFNSMANSLALLESSRRSFVANVSHELKTPMTTIGGFIDGIIDGTISGAEQEKKYLGIVSDEIKRLSRLISSMLNMSKIEAGELNLLPKKYSLSDQIFNCLLIFEREISNKNLQILGLDAMENIILRADEDLINQVIYNLLDNAVKFTPPGGTISFEAFAENNFAVIKIKNTGVGIAADDLGRVFDRFYKVDKSRSMDIKSVGLGLHIVKKILELHDAFISVSSDEDQFVEFTLRIPLGIN